MGWFDGENYQINSQGMTCKENNGMIVYGEKKLYIIESQAASLDGRVLKRGKSSENVRRAVKNLGVFMKPGIFEDLGTKKIDTSDKENCLGSQNLRKKYILSKGR